jgi:hypothetical protein
VVSHVAGKKGWNHIASPDTVVVALGAGGVAGVEVFGHFIHGEYPDGGGETIIEHNAKIRGRDRAFSLEGYDLGEGVDSSVRASGALRQQLLPCQALYGAGQGALNGRLAGLNLPSVEGRAVIGEREF